MRKPESAPVEAPNQLALSVDRLAGELRVFRQVLDEVREDFSWVTRNGLPVNLVEYTCVKRMALDPCAEDWGEKLVIERSTYDPRTGSPLDSPSLDRVVEELEQTIEAVAQGQLEVVLTALDGVREELLKAIRGKGKESDWEPREVNQNPNPIQTAVSNLNPSEPVRSNPTPLPPSKEPHPKPPPGRLF